MGVWAGEPGRPTLGSSQGTPVRMYRLALQWSAGSEPPTWSPHLALSYRRLGARCHLLESFNRPFAAATGNTACQTCNAAGGEAECCQSVTFACSLRLGVTALALRRRRQKEKREVGTFRRDGSGETERGGGRGPRSNWQGRAAGNLNMCAAGAYCQRFQPLRGREWAPGATHLQHV